MKKRYVIGGMSGTSMDGIDVALVEVEGAGLDMMARFVRGASRSYGELADPLRQIANGTPASDDDLKSLALRIGRQYAAAVSQLIREGEEPVAHVGVHGQTIHHRPPESLQLIDPSPIAEQAGIPVAFDFRSADLKAGGQGAPITPLADHILFRDNRETRAVVNLGGFINYTLLPKARGIDAIRGADVCVCNQVLDAIARRCFGAPFDEGGARAFDGEVHPVAGPTFNEIIRSQAAGKRSLGSGDEALHWLDRFADKVSGEDLAATASSAIAMLISDLFDQSTDRIILAGGGVRNAFLKLMLHTLCKTPVVTSTDFDIPIEYREAVCMAVLTAMAADGIPITLPQITGRDPNVRIMPRWIAP